VFNNTTPEKGSVIYMIGTNNSDSLVSNCDFYNNSAEKGYTILLLDSTL